MSDAGPDDATPRGTDRLPLVDRDSWGSLDDTHDDDRYRLVVVRSRRD